MHTTSALNYLCLRENPCVDTNKYGYTVYIFNFDLRLIEDLVHNHIHDKETSVYVYMNYKAISRQQALWIWLNIQWSVVPGGSFALKSVIIKDYSIMLFSFIWGRFCRIIIFSLLGHFKWCWPLFKSYKQKGNSSLYHFWSVWKHFLATLRQKNFSSFQAVYSIK